MIAWFRYICLIVSLIITMPELLSAQRLVSQRQEDVEAGLLYNESVYILSNYSCLSSNSPEKLSLDELLRKQIEGFYFYLKRDTETNVLLLRKPDGTFTPFSESLEAIKTALDADSTKVMTLFLDFYVETELESSFKEIGLMEYVLEYDTKNGWPSLKDMLSSGKRLVVFEVQKHLNSPSWLHNMRDFVEHTDADWGNQPEAREKLRIDKLSPSEKGQYYAHMEALRYQKSVIETGWIEGHADGRAEGRAEGIAEGKAEGRAEGIAEGQNLEKRQIAANLKKQGLPIEIIANCTGLSPEEIANC